MRQDFNIPKVHSMVHYVPAIIDFGSVLGLSTDGPERLHIDMAKMAFRASNRKGSQYVRQMILWLTRREKLHGLDTYIEWASAELASALAEYPNAGRPTPVSFDTAQIIYDDELDDTVSSSFTRVTTFSAMRLPSPLSHRWILIGLAT